MGLDSPLLAAPFIILAMVAMFFAEEAWRREHSPGSLSFALLMLLIVIWLLASVGTQLSNIPELKIFWAKIAYFTTSWLGTLWLLFSIEFAYRHSNFLDRYGWVLWGLPVVSVAVVFTNEIHHWLWREITISPEGIPIYTRGFWVWVVVLYNYFLLFAGAVVLMRGLTRFPFYKRRQVAALLVGMLLPWLANFSYMVGWIPQTSTDITPFTFALTGILYTWTLYRMRLFDPVPLAREVILDQIGEGFMVFDRQHRLLDINLAARRLLGIGDRQVAGRQVNEILVGRPELASLFQGDAAAQQVELAGEGDAELNLEASLLPWYSRDKKQAGTILILYDITRRAKAERERKVSEQRYRLLVNSLPVGVATLDPDGRISFASPETYELFKMDPQADLLGSSVLDWIHPDDRRLAAARIQQVAQGGEDLDPLAYRLVNKDGQIFWGEITSTMLVGEGGESQGMLSIIRDVTRSKEMEFQLERNLNQQTFINDLLQMMFRPTNLVLALTDALKRTGEYLDIDRVYLCEDSPAGEETTVFLEWCNEHVHPRAKEGPLVRYAEIPSWRKWIEKFAMIRVPAGGLRPIPSSAETDANQTLPEDLREYMDAWGIKALAAFPVYGAENRPFGFLGFDECQSLRNWGEDEINLLGNVCKIISGAVSQMQVEVAEQQQRVLTEAMVDTAKAMASTLNFDEVLDRVLANLEMVVKSDAASIAMVDDEGIVKFVRWRGYDEPGSTLMTTNRFHISERETYQGMSLTREPVVIPDTWLDKSWRPEKEYSWIRCYAGAPIVVKGKVVGFLNLDSREVCRYSDDVVDRLRLFADQAAIAISNAQLYNLAQSRADEMAMLYRIGLSLTANMEMDQVLASLFEQCRSVLPIDVFYVLLYDAQKDQLSQGIFYQEGEFLNIDPRMLAGMPGMTGIVIRERRTIVIQDTFQTETEGKYKLRRMGGTPARSYVAVPLIILDQVVGVISMQNFHPFAYSDEQVKLLETIATQAAIAVQNARLYENLRLMAITDSLTQLFTRHHFTVMGHNEVERARRYGRVLSVLMVDVDRFKLVNDTYGHYAGDYVLQAVAQTCSQVLRATDLVGRWGGEEFTILLPEADQEGALMIAERIRRIVEECEITIADGKVIRVTVSLGIATLGNGLEKLEDLVDCADKAMFQAKQAGRNRVRAWENRTV